MTEEQIERAVCFRTDRIDARYMRDELSPQEYVDEMAKLNDWAEAQYRLATA